MDSKTIDPIFVLRTISSITCIRYGKNVIEDRVLFSGSSDGTLSIWSVRQNRPIKVIKAHPGNSVLDITQLRDGSLLTHGRDGYVKHWTFVENEETLNRCIDVYGLGFCPASVLFQKDNETLVGFQAASDSEVKVLSLESKNVDCCLKPAEKLGMVMQMKLFDDAATSNTFALIGYEDGSIALWDLIASKVIAKLKLYNDPIMSLDLDSHHSKAACGSADEKLVQFSVDAKNGMLQELRTSQLKSKGISSLKIRSDCRIVAAGCWDGRIRVFGWKKLKPLAILQYHSEGINSLDFSHDNTLACASKDGRISLWSIYSNV